jgi:hypothetical protein
MVSYIMDPAKRRHEIDRAGKQATGIANPAFMT